MISPYHQPRMELAVYEVDALRFAFKKNLSAGPQL